MLLAIQDEISPQQVSQQTKHSPRYAFDDINERSFSVTYLPKNRKAVITLSDNFWKFNLNWNGKKWNWDRHGVDNPIVEHSASYNLFDFYSIIEKIACVIKNDFFDEDSEELGIPKPTNKQQRGKHKGVKNWTKTKTMKCLARRITTRLRKLLEQVPPDIIKAHKNAMMVLGPKNYASCGELQEKEPKPYFWKDLKNYPASILGLHKFGLYKVPSLIRATTWQDAFCTTPSKTVMKTLQKITRKLALLELNKVMCSGIKLPKVYENNQEAMFAFCCLAHENGIIHQDTIFNSSLKQFKKAIKLVVDHLNRRAKIYSLDFRKQRELLSHLSYIMDYPEKTNCEIVGLAEKSIRWHEQQNAIRHRENELRELQRTMERKEAEKQYEEFVKSSTKMPPIPLPDDKNIRFLDTVKAIHEESDLMNHCVRNYDKRAVAGSIYLFHIDYKGEMATAEIDHLGNLQQIKGPHNSLNAATKYGKEVLTKWGNVLRSKLLRLEAYLEIDKINRQQKMLEIPLGGPYKRYVDNTLEQFANNIVEVPSGYITAAEDEIPF